MIRYLLIRTYRPMYTNQSVSHNKTRKATKKIGNETRKGRMYGKRKKLTKHTLIPYVVVRCV